MESQSAGSTPLDRSSPENFVIVRTDSRSARASDLEEVVRAAGDHDVVLVGECHDDPTAHRLEILLLQRLFAKHGKTRNVMLSLEMFETDVQLTLDEYLRGEIRERDMLTDCRPWVNYSCRRPLVEFARANNIPVIAANAPRRYVSSVGRAGTHALGLSHTGESNSFTPRPCRHSQRIHFPHGARRTRCFEFVTAYIASVSAAAPLRAALKSLPVEV